MYISKHLYIRYKAKYEINQKKKQDNTKPVHYCIFIIISKTNSKLKRMKKLHSKHKKLKTSKPTYCLKGIVL